MQIRLSLFFIIFFIFFKSVIYAEDIPSISGTILEEIDVITKKSMQQDKEINTKANKKQDKVKKTVNRSNSPIPQKKATNKSTENKQAISVAKKQNFPSSTIDKINIIPGENTILIISGNHPNRIMTPFNSPVIHTVSNAKFEVIGSVIYVTAPLDSGPITMFVTEENDESIALSLTLVPRAIPPREIHLKLKMPKYIDISTPKAKKWESSQPYIDMLKKVMVALAKGEIPPGYNLRNITSYDPQPICENIIVEPDQVIDGHRIKVVISKATNLTNKKVLFNEASCYQDKVLAVAVWPYALLEPGQSTELYIIYKKEYGQDSNKRPFIVR